MKERPMPWVLCPSSVKKFFRLENLNRSRGLNALLLSGKLSGYTVTVASLDRAVRVLVMVASLSHSWSESSLPANACHDVVIGGHTALGWSLCLRSNGAGIIALGVLSSGHLASFVVLAHSQVSCCLF